MQSTSNPAWAELNAEQQQILAPLKPDWETLEPERKRKWIGIAKRSAKPPKGSDIWAVKSNLISVTPLCLDFTDRGALDELASVLGEGRK